MHAHSKIEGNFRVNPRIADIYEIFSFVTSENSIVTKLLKSCFQQVNLFMKIDQYRAVSKVTFKY